MKTYEVTLTITLAKGRESPVNWDWPTLLDLNTGAGDFVTLDVIKVVGDSDEEDDECSENQ
jgi:hypothetical protein